MQGADREICIPGDALITQFTVLVVLLQQEDLAEHIPSSMHRVK